MRVLIEIFKNWHYHNNGHIRAYILTDSCQTLQCREPGSILAIALPLGKQTLQVKAAAPTATTTEFRHAMYRQAGVTGSLQMRHPARDDAAK